MNVNKRENKQLQHESIISHFERSLPANRKFITCTAIDRNLETDREKNRIGWKWNFVFSHHSFDRANDGRAGCEV